jgi:hypothetical protein
MAGLVKCPGACSGDVYSERSEESQARPARHNPVGPFVALCLTNPPPMRRTLVIFLTLLLLWTLVAELNHALTALRVYLFVGGLFVTYAALMLPLRVGLAASLLGGLLCDATTPVWFGTHLLLFASAHAVVFHLRKRLPRDDTVARVVAALLANLAIFLLLSFTQIGDAPAPAAAWLRLFADLACSQVFLALIAPWFFALQARALVLARAEQRDNLV